MLPSRRWRDWTPIGKSEDASTCGLTELTKSAEVRPHFELTKLTKQAGPNYVSFVGDKLRNSQIVSSSDGWPGVDPSAWAEEVHKWRASRCYFSDRCLGGLGSLHRDFCEWTIANDSVPCNLQTFQQLLVDLRFSVVNGLVYGLVLRAEFEIGLSLVAPVPLCPEVSLAGQPIEKKKT